MKIKNITKDRNFILKAGNCGPGKESEATYEESKLLFGQGLAEVVVAKAKPAFKSKEK